MFSGFSVQPSFLVWRGFHKDEALRRNKKMGNATEKQVIALKRFARNSELSQGILKGVQFDELSKEEASELIKKCYEQGSSNGNGNGFLTGKTGDFVIRFSQNYRNGDGDFKTVYLTDEEEEAVRMAHKEHCIDVMKDLQDDYPEDRELQLAMFEKRADKIFTWIQQGLDEKVRKTRGAGNGN